MFVFDFGKYAYLHHPDVICSLFKKKYTYLNRLVVVCFDFKKVCWLTSPRRCLFFILKSMLTGYLERSSSHGPMLAYLMLHLQVGIRTQTRTEIAILSSDLTMFSEHLAMCVLIGGKFSFWISKCCLFFLILSLQILKQRQQDCQRSPVFGAFEICPSFCAMHFYFKQIFSFWKIGSIPNPPVPSNSKSNQQWGSSTIISAISKGFCLDASGKSPSAS